MSTPNNVTAELTDEAARAQILTDLDTNLLVEAGAGSGKTTSLVGRMLALVERGEPIDCIAAVTFTRKAANELRERFQMRLEQKIAAAAGGSEQAVRFDRALHDLDHAFIGTIHAFCARLLREHPIEATLDPRFQEMTDDKWDELIRAFWNRWIDRAKRSDEPVLRRLTALGIDPRALFDGFCCVVQFSDVDFSVSETAPPDVNACRCILEQLLDRAAELVPNDEPEDGWDPLMLLVRRLAFRRDMGHWSDIAAFCQDLERITKSHCDITQKRWSVSPAGKKAAKALNEDFLALLDGSMAEILRCWREHRYPVVMGFLKQAADEFVRERHTTGQLGFEDLLLLSARLLRDHPDVRTSLGHRYARLLIDEFQDTDPIQAEVCFLLASDPSEGNDWTRVTPRPGSLFLVGDPKQSIYRFRRADIQVYELAKSRIAACGATLALTRNFRSVHPIAGLVNDYFRETFPASANDVQAMFTPMQTVKDPTPPDGVFRYTVRPPANNKGAIAEADATHLASWIERRIHAGERAAGDFLILTAFKEHIGLYARALSERNIPVSTSGARLPQERELRELLVVLHAIADPENPVFVVAALEGMFFGCSPVDLYDAKLEQVRFVVTRPPATGESVVGSALSQLYTWWMVSQRHAADILLETIIEDTGLLAYAAGQSLGEARAGALLHLVEVLRTLSTSVASGITDAIERIRVLLANEADDAPLRPGRTDAVRIMNLHKAKGLEAPVVVLAAPVDYKVREPSAHVNRGEPGVATGGLIIRDEQHIIAQPPDWDAMSAVESRFAAAERERLLYVAVTRAKSELLVAQCERMNKSGPIPDTSTWSPLATLLDIQAPALTLEPTPASGRRTIDVSTEELRGRVGAAHNAVKQAAVPSIRTRTVRELAKMRDDFNTTDISATEMTKTSSPVARGVVWGNAVHRCIEAMGRGRDGESLRAFVRAVSAESELSDEDTTALEQLLTTVRASQAWQQLSLGEVRHVELPVMYRTSTDSVEELIEGVVDAATRSGDQWHVIDWKTDSVSGDEWARRAAGYAAQAQSYADILTALTGGSASTSVERVG